MIPFKPLAILTVFLFSSIALPGQSSGKYLKQLLQPDFTLYFIKPVILKAGGASFVADFTYRHYPTPEQAGPVTVNFSLFTREPVRSAEALQLGPAGAPTAIVAPTLLYLEQKKGKWHSRFTADLTLTDYLSLLELGGEFSATLSNGTQRWHFTANRRWEQSAEVVGTILQSLQEQNETEN